MAWMDWRRPTDWSQKEAVGSTACLVASEAVEVTPDTQTALEPLAAHEALAAPAFKQLTPAMKEVLRLRKKLREIAKIEERLEAGMGMDPLQQPKLAKKEEMKSQLEQAEQAASEEQAEWEEHPADQVEQDALLKPAGLQAADHHTLQAPSHLAPMNVVQVPMLLCGMLAQQHEVQQQQQQQQPFAWQAYAFPSQDPQFAFIEQQAPMPPHVWQPFTEHDAEHANPILSTSAKRRLRRQRAVQAQRKPEALDMQAEAPAPLPQVSSPSNDTCTSNLGCDELTQALESGGQARDAVLAKLRGSVAQAAFESEGCRVVQAAIQMAEHAVLAELLLELHGYVREALASPHGNYVIQTIITALPLAMSAFVVKELIGVGAFAARHRFGCRILCRLIEHYGASDDLSVLMDEVLAEAEDLCRHPFAHHVLERALEHLPERRARIARALSVDLLGHARHRCASHVVEAALLHCEGETREGLARGLQGNNGVAILAHSQFGSYVLRGLLRLAGPASEEARRQLTEAAPDIRASRPGQRLLRDLGIQLDA